MRVIDTVVGLATANPHRATGVLDVTGVVRLIDQGTT
jgi:hypothetical protein